MDNGKEAIKLAFKKIKQDILTLGEEMSSFKLELLDLKNNLKILDESINKIKLSQLFNSTDNSLISTNLPNPTDNPTHFLGFKEPKYPNFNTSIGNEGVPTNRQTDKQTNNPTDFNLKNEDFEKKPIEQTISEATNILNSLDALKKQIRLKFKSLTNQEMLVFSTIYQLEEQGIQEIDYSKISQKLALSESSIRDYVQRLINKGISIHKIKFNNKKIFLSISSELKKIASLDTILQLREI